MPTVRSTFSWMLAALSSIFLVAGCGTDDPAASGGGAAGAANCASGTFTVAGNSSMKKGIAAWIEAYQQRCTDVAVNFDGQGSGYGRTQFVQKHVPMASSLASLTGDQKVQAQQRCAPGAAVDLPMAIIPITLSYNLPGVDRLILTPSLIARIFDGKIKRWNDPQLVAVNPGVALPDKSITPVFFSADAGTSENLTRFLVKQAPADWPHKPSQSWPVSIGIGAAISTTIVQAVKNTDGALGYVDYPDAVDNKLSLAALDTGKGPVMISSESVAKVLTASTTSQDGQDITLDLAYGLHEAGAYPAIMAVYEITCTRGLPAAQARFVKSFLTLTSSDEGQRLLADARYIPLPPDLHNRVTTAVAQLAAG